MEEECGRYMITKKVFKDSNETGGNGLLSFGFLYNIFVQIFWGLNNIFDVIPVIGYPDDA